MRNNSKRVIAALTAVVLICSMFLLTGCSVFFNTKVKSIGFTVESLSLEIGQTKDINSTVVEVLPKTANNRKFTVTSEDSSKISVSADIATPYKLITALGLGTTNITVTSEDGGFSASLPVTVTYAKISDFNITYNEADLTKAGNIIVMDSNAPTAIDFGVSLSKNCDPNTEVKWHYTFNDIENMESAKTLKTSESYSFNGSEVGRYSVYATATDSGKDFKAYANINICKPIENAEFTHDGELVQKENNYSVVQFDLSFVNPDGNPDAIIEWFINDEKQRTENKQLFSYKPILAGEYIVSAKINGAKVGSSVTIIARGSVIPKNVMLDYDNCYPKVFVRWTEIPLNIGYSVDIINNTTGTTVAADLNTSNTAIKNKFSRSGFDATEYLTKTGATIFDTTFTVKVKTLGNQIFTESDYSRPFTSKRIDSAAKQYLEVGFYDGDRNLYITNENEFAEWLAYSTLWRVTKQTLYFAFSYTSMEDLLARVPLMMHFTGERYISTTTKGKEVNITITFSTDGAPSLSINNGGAKINQWNGARPHVNYIDSNGRDDSFAIDKKPAVAVETSDQLYYVAELGYKPVPVSGSAAQSIYNNARKVLRNIITDDFTDVEKVHAIYDYIMWRVTYDHAVVDKIDGLPKDDKVPTAVKYNSYYLESVLGDKDYFAVCDGMAKAFSLMSNIEGLPCMRVAGDAGSGAIKGGHAWNKVFVDGGWYIVDCTWGDSLSENGIEGGQKESANHMYFMLTDSEVAATHVEKAGIPYPKTPTSSYNFYDNDIVSNGVTLDFYLNGITTLDAECKLLSNYMVDSVLSLRAAGNDLRYAVGPDKISVSNQTSTSFFSIDVKVAENVEAYFLSGSSTDPITKALSAKGLRANTDFSIFATRNNGSLILLITLRLAAVKA